METCCICGESQFEDQNFSVLTEKGCNSINQVDIAIRATPGNRVHKKCRVNLLRPKKSACTTACDHDESTNVPVRCRSAKSQFNPGENCIFCGQLCNYDCKRKGSDVYSVRTMEFKETILNVCKERNYDDWAQTVLGRIEFLNDLHATDTVYHQTCSINFRTGKNVPKQFSESKSKRVKAQGRPVDSVKDTAFMEAVQYLIENEDEQLTVLELTQKMAESLEDTEEEAYSVVYMKKRLKEHFGDKIMISSTKKKPNVITFIHNVASIVQEFFIKPQSTDVETEKSRIVETAARLIKSDVMNMDSSSETYPARAEMSSVDAALEFVPDLLQLFLKTLMPGKDVRLKLASLGQALVQATRPRQIVAPLQFGLGVQMHHHFASRFLIDSLNAHGFSSSYSTIQKYERSAAVTQGIDIPGWVPGRFVQYVADNVDHNSRTIDGSGTFHGMGIIATITPGTNTSVPIPRRSVTAQDIAQAGRIDIRPYHGPSEDTPKLQCKELQKLHANDATANLDLLWKLTVPLTLSPRPGWSGMMNNVCHGIHPGKSSIMFLPMIDLDPSNMTCIYSTLSFITEQAFRYEVTPLVTFDQPLWWKALLIIEEEPQGSKMKSIVLRLGGLHTEMSFLGCKGHLMAASGLEDVLELVYAKNAVSHMLSGKAIARAIRGHFLLDAALNTLLVCDTFGLHLPVPLNVSQEASNIELDDDDMDHDDDGAEPASNNELNKEHEQTVDEIVDENDEDRTEQVLEIDLELVKTLHKQLVETPQMASQVNCSGVLNSVAKKLEEKRVSLKDHRTAMLWLQYMKMLDILRRFIKGERTGNWSLHLQAVSDMLPYFAAAGHNLYAKSVYIYLQFMQDLEKTNPAVYKSFMEGLHVVRRTDRFWAGLSTDLIIEQVLMRSIKTSGGLTRGRGLTETQRLVWVMSMPACADVNNAMQELTGTNFNTSEQHTSQNNQYKDATKAMKERDHNDTMKIVDYLSHRSPFGSGKSLCNIATGVVAEKSVNCDRAKEVGDKVIQSMVDKNIHDYTFQKKNQAITLASKIAVQLSDEKVQIDPQLLFQRLSFTATSGRYDNPQTLFKYEMSSYPSALFDNSLLPRQANKPVLADAIWTQTEGVQTERPQHAHYVIDGGALIHRVVWPPGSTYDAICFMYICYVEARYGKATIVFDGYDDGPSTKTCTHQRRTNNICAQPVLFDSDMIVPLKKKDFLSNQSNKQRFINILADNLRDAGHTILQANGDADLLIVKTAVQSTRSQNTVLVGDDTDLLILMLYHGEMDTNDLFFIPQPKKNSKTRRIWNIKKTKSALGPDVCSNILYMHALLGCDTTSRVHGIGKGVALKKFNNNALFRDQARVFSNPDVSKDEVIAAGERSLVCLYNGLPTESLDSLRYTRFCHKVTSGNACVPVESLPPTSAAASFHSLRVYLQVQQWKDNQLPPQQWGWELIEERFVPITTNLPPAHPSLLEIIRCNCKTDCNTRRCSCLKNGLDCTAACGVCKGASCKNSTLVELTEL